MTPSEYWASKATVTPLAKDRPVAPFEIVYLKLKGMYFSHQDPEAENNLPKPVFLPGLSGAAPFYWVCRVAFIELILVCSSLALEQLLTELDDFLKVLDQENLSSAAVLKKSGLSELLRLYTKSSSKYGPGASGGLSSVQRQLSSHTSRDQLPESKEWAGLALPEDFVPGVFSHSHLCVCLYLPSIFN